MSRENASGASTRRLIDMTADELFEVVDQRLALHFVAAPPGGDDLLDRAGAAKFLNVSVAQLDKLIRETSSLPFHWVGESKRFERSELLAWVRNPPESTKPAKVGGAKAKAAT